VAVYDKLRSDDPKVQEARQRAGRIVNAMNNLAALVQEAWDNNDHTTLGYETWQSYTIGEFGHGDTAIKARQVIVSMLRGTGLSQRAIARETGASPATVHNDLADLTAEPPEGDPATVDRRSTAQPVEQTATITGLDGRNRPAARGGMDGEQRRARRQERDRARRAERVDLAREAVAQVNAEQARAVVRSRMEPPAPYPADSASGAAAARAELSRRNDARILIAANFNLEFRQWLGTLDGEQLDVLEENWENISRAALAAMASWIGAHDRARNASMEVVTGGQASDGT